MTRRRKPPYRAAGAWLWIDTYVKLPTSAKLVILGLVALVGMIIAAYWWIILICLTLLAAWRYWLNAGGPGSKGNGKDAIPYGKLSLISWTACRLIGLGEKILARHNMKRPTP